MGYRFLLVFHILCLPALFAGEAGLDGLKAEEAQVRVDTARQIAKQRALVVQDLMAIAQGKQNASLFSDKELAINLLGRLRAEEAVMVLIQNVTFDPVRVGSESLFAPPPCVDALIKIGTPAVRGITSRVESAATDKELDLFLRILTAIDGKELTIARLELLLKKDASDVLRANLAKMLESAKAKGDGKGP